MFGLITGFIAGMFGIGGGFLATPLLIFVGIPPAIAVATSTNQIIASSTSGLLIHLRKGNVDIKMGLVLVIGGFFGSFIGIYIFKFLQKTGQIDIAVSIIYVVFLGTIGLNMLINSIKQLLESKYQITWEKEHDSAFARCIAKAKKMPLQVEFPKSQITVSLFVPIILSMLIGVLVVLMGIGGGFLMIPAMISILKMRSEVVTGTSLFQIIFIAANATFLQAMNNNLDIVLAALMILTSAIGSQIGTKTSYKIDTERLRSFLALLILAVCLKMLISLFTDPANIYSLEIIK